MNLPLEVMQIELIESKVDLEETQPQLVVLVNSTDNLSHFVHIRLVDATACDKASDTSTFKFDKQASISPSRNVGAENKQISPTSFYFDLSETQFTQLKNNDYKLRLRLAEGRPIKEQSKCTLEFELRKGHYYKEQLP